MTPREALQALLDGVSAGRWNELPALYALDTVVEHPLARDRSRMLYGRDALVAHFDRIGATGIRLVARTPVFLDAADPELVIAEFIYDGTTATGTTFDVSACFIWRVRDGLIVHSRDYLGALPTSGKDYIMTDPNIVDPDETTATRRTRGEDIVTALSGGTRPASLDALDAEYPFLSNAVNAFAVGEIFNRDVLDVKTRQLALVAAFAALGLGNFIKIHGGYALNAGASEAELKEIANLTIIPGGFPRAIQASQAISELLESRKHQPSR